MIEVECEVTGSVWKILVEGGAYIEEDEPLMIIESMKMEIPVTAPVGGKVVRIIVGEGDSVSSGDIVAHLEIG